MNFLGYFYYMVIACCHLFYQIYSSDNVFRNRKNSTPRHNHELVTTEKVHHRHGRARSLIFRLHLVPIKSGGKRPLIDLSELKEYLIPKPFEKTTLVKVKQGADACYWISIKESKNRREYICVFRIRGKKYMFRLAGDQKMLYLAFGLKTAPWAFTEVVTQIKR